MSAQREKNGEMLGSASYDQDLDFVDLYVRYIHNEADEDERKSLELHYISKLYSYKSKLIHFLDTITFEELPIVIKSHMIGEHLANGGKYIKGEHSVFSRALSDMINQIKSSVTSYLDESIREINEEFSIKKVQQAFMLVSLAFCLNLDSVTLSKTPEKINPTFESRIKYGDKFCYLTNDTGIFGLNTWLYAFFNGVHLIGVPSKYASFDSSAEECPTNFEHHDYVHTHMIEKYGTHHDVARKLYIQILDDPEATQLQKELLILCLWVQIHESNFGEIKNDLLKFFNTTEFFYLDIFVQPDFWEEYNRFRDLVLTQELLDQFHSKIGNYKDKITPTNITEFRDFIDDQSQHLYSRIEMLARLIFFYYREYCKKYYFRV